MSTADNINTSLAVITDSHRVALSVDCVIFGYDEISLKILVRECEMPPYIGRLSLVGDLVQADEELDDAAFRVLEKRTGLTINQVYLEQVASFSKVDRHPLGRVISVAYYSLVKINEVKLHQTSGLEATRWVNIADVGKMAFDHNDILDTCLQLLRKRMREEPIGFGLLPKKFTLQKLQTLYEVVLETTFDKRNFRRKLKSQDLLLDLKEKESGVAHRPAKLFAFNYSKYRQLKSKKKSIWNLMSMQNLSTSLNVC
jgi:8-oxo-dGTP diphosphatase